MTSAVLADRRLCSIALTARFLDIPSTPPLRTSPLKSHDSMKTVAVCCVCRKQLLGNGLSSQNIRDLYMSRQPLPWENNFENLDAVKDVRARSIVASLLRCTCTFVQSHCAHFGPGLMLLLCLRVQSSGHLQERIDILSLHMSGMT